MFFPRANLPGLLQWVSDWLPLTQVVELVRPLFLGRWPDHALLHLVVLACYTLLAWNVALALTRESKKKLGS